MNLLQRQLLGEFFKVFFLTLAVLLLFILMGNALQMRNMLFGLSVGVVDMARLFVYLSPLFLLMLCPVACMLAAFMAFLRMGTDRELVALRAGGISLYQMLPAALLFACLCAALSLWLGLVGQGWGRGNFRAEVLEIASNRAQVIVRPGVFNNDIPNMTFFARRADIATGTLAQVLVEDTSRPGTRLTILAPEGSIGTDYERGDLMFLLKNGRIYTDRGSAVTVLGFEEYVVRIALDRLFSGLDLGPVKPKDMGWKELMSFSVAEVAQTDERLANKLVVERHKRWVFPAACIILCLFAIPIAASFQGMQQQTGVVLGLVLFLVYFSLLSLGISMAEAGNVPAIPALWGPNILFLSLAIVGIRLAAKERMPRVPYMMTWSRRKIRAKRSDREKEEGAA